MEKRCSNFIHVFLSIVLLWLTQPGANAQAKDSVWIMDKNGCKVHNPHPVKDETISWSGECAGGYASGPGTLVWYKNGRRNQEFVGNMRRGVPHGKGRYLYDDQSIWEGIYVGGELNGPGKIINMNWSGGISSVYVGELKAASYSGYGQEIQFADSGDTLSIYKGEFLNDERHGSGVLKQFKYGGVTQVAGNFEEGMLTGNAIIHQYDNGTLINVYSGQFSDHGRNGYGDEITGLVRYSGQWIQNAKEGQGKLYLDTMLIYEGEWHNDKFNGTGKRFYFDGSFYSGEFKDNHRHGVGAQYWPNGMQYIGEFRNDLYVGYGFITKNKQIEVCGKWANGRLASPDNIKRISDRLTNRYNSKLLQLGISLP